MRVNATQLQRADKVAVLRVFIKIQSEFQG